MVEQLLKELAALRLIPFSCFRQSSGYASTNMALIFFLIFSFNNLLGKCYATYHYYHQFGGVAFSGPKYDLSIEFILATPW